MGTGPKPADHPSIVDRDTPDLRRTPERAVIDLRGDGPLVSLGHYRYLTARDSMPPQRHASLLVLALPSRGTVEFALDGCVTDVAPGQVIVIPPHTVYATAGNAQPRGELFWLVLRVPADDDPTSGPLHRAARQLADGDGLTWTVPGSVIDDLGRALADPDDQRWVVNGARRARCVAAVFEVLLARAARVEQSIPPGVRRALAYVNERLDCQISVPDLIASSGMSPTQFYDAFTATMGTSPKDYVLRAKIARARVLLAETTLNITGVCHQLGFSSSQHFAEVFRRYEGMSPSQFRRDAAVAPGEIGGPDAIT